MSNITVVLVLFLGEIGDGVFVEEVGLEGGEISVLFVGLGFLF